MDPYRQLSRNEMRQVDHAVSDLMAVITAAKAEHAKRQKEAAACTSAKQSSRQTVSAAA